jgi:hypothetical protein
MHAFDVHDTMIDPPELWSVQLGGCIEATPAAWNGRIYVGTRGGYELALAYAYAWHDCSKVTAFFGGGSDDAKVVDAAALDALETRMSGSESTFREFRPDLLGETIAFHDDGDTHTDIVYFTSEAEARANEQKQPTAEIEQLMELLTSAVAVDEYIDLEDPTLR